MTSRNHERYNDVLPCVLTCVILLLKNQSRVSARLFDKVVLFDLEAQLDVNTIFCKLKLTLTEFQYFVNSMLKQFIGLITLAYLDDHKNYSSALFAEQVGLYCLLSVLFLRQCNRAHTPILSKHAMVNFCLAVLSAAYFLLFWHSESVTLIQTFNIK